MTEQKVLTKHFNNFEHQKNWIGYELRETKHAFDNETMNKLSDNYYEEIKYVIVDDIIHMIDAPDDMVDAMNYCLQNKKFEQKEVNEMQELIKDYIREEKKEVNRLYMEQVDEVFKNNAIAKEFEKFKNKVKGMLKDERADNVDFFSCESYYAFLTDEEKKTLSNLEKSRDENLEYLSKKEKTLITLLNACETYQQKATLLVSNGVIDTTRIIV